MFANIDQEPLPEIVDTNNTDEEIESAVLKLRKDLKIYNALQMKLMLLKYGSRQEASAQYEDWDLHDSKEFSEAFHEIVRDMMQNDPHFVQKLQLADDEVVKIFHGRIKVIHTLQEKLSHHFAMIGKGNDDLEEWRRQYNSCFLETIHAQPKLVETFIKTEDTNPSEQENVLRKIEELLY